MRQRGGKCLAQKIGVSRAYSHAAAPIGALVLLIVFFLSPVAADESIVVRHPEGLSHGFLRLRNENGAVLASGETTQRRRGNEVIAQLMFRFRDGSRYDETTVFTQQRQFRLVSDHVIQRGPAFPEASDVLIDARSGNVTVHYTDDGDQKVANEHMDLPPDLANGIVQTLLKNVGPDAIPESFPYVAATPKPRLIKLRLSVNGSDRFRHGSLIRRATHYVLKAELGGVTGVVAPIIGKQPPDSHVWIVAGDAPGFLRAKQPFFSGGPLWTIELAAPEWTVGG
jgi:hypothetical protein